MCLYDRMLLCRVKIHETYVICDDSPIVTDLCRCAPDDRYSSTLIPSRSLSTGTSIVNVPSTRSCSNHSVPAVTQPKWCIAYHSCLCYHTAAESYDTRGCSRNATDFSCVYHEIGAKDHSRCIPPNPGIQSARSLVPYSPHTCSATVR